VRCLGEGAADLVDEEVALDDAEVLIDEHHLAGLEEDEDRAAVVLVLRMVDDIPLLLDQEELLALQVAHDPSADKAEREVIVPRLGEAAALLALDLEAPAGQFQQAETVAQQSLKHQTALRLRWSTGLCEALDLLVVPAAYLLVFRIAEVANNLLQLEHL